MSCVTLRARARSEFLDRFFMLVRLRCFHVPLFVMVTRDIVAVCRASGISLSS